MVKNEDNYIKQWINYHHSIGINKFIIYDNAGIDDKKSYCSIEGVITSFTLTSGTVIAYRL